MKKILLLILIILPLVSKSQVIDTTNLSWDTKEHDFGKIPFDVPATYKFYFTNKGKKPVFINNVEVSCGCTTPKWTEGPINPGNTGFLEATYNAKVLGVFNKIVTLSAQEVNPDKTIYIIPTKLVLKGEVVDNK